MHHNKPRLRHYEKKLQTKFSHDYRRKILCVVYQYNGILLNSKENRVLIHITTEMNL